MRNLFLSLFLYVLSTQLYGQYKDYDLNSYINPDYQRKSLDINLNSSGNFVKNNSQTTNDLNGVFSFSFNRIRTSRKVQETMNSGISTDASVVRFDSIDNQKTRSYTVGLNFIQKAHYYIKGDKFIEVSPCINAGYNYTKSKKASTDYINRFKNAFSSDMEVDLGIGKGRIENVTDARQVIYILQDLSDKGILKKVLTEDEINQFAQQISLIKNKRQFDAREKTIEELKYITNYMIENGYIDEVNSADYFLSLNDFWKNGDSDVRQAGHRFKFGVSPSFEFHEDRISFENDYLSRDNSVDSKWGGTLYLDYTLERPVNLKWQRSFNTGIRNQLYRWRTRGCNEFLMHAYTTFGMGCYVDTRTYIAGTISQNFYWNRTPETAVLDKANTLSSKSNLGIKGYYYISPQLRLFGEYNVSYSFFREAEINRNKSDKYPANQFQVGLSFAIF